MTVDLEQLPLKILQIQNINEHQMKDNLKSTNIDKAYLQSFTYFHYMAYMKQANDVSLETKGSINILKAVTS